VESLDWSDVYDAVCFMVSRNGLLDVLFYICIYRSYRYNDQ